MKLRFVIVMLTFVLMLSGCGAAETLQTEAQANVDVFYSQEQAMLEGWLVVQDGDVRHNQQNWMDFLETANAGNPASIQIAHYTSGEQGSSCIRYDLTFDGTAFQLDGPAITETAPELTFQSGVLDETMEPYDRFESYSLGETVLYVDLIAEPDYSGVTEIALHAKEGDPAIKAYSDEATEGILTLLSDSVYLPCPPEEYCYGMKLIMTNGLGSELVIELDLQQGIYRFGQQHYTYGEIADMLSVLGLEAWPKEVLAEFGLN